MSVVFPASGCEMMPNVRRRATSRTISLCAAGDKLDDSVEVGSIWSDTINALFEKLSSLPFLGHKVDYCHSGYFIFLTIGALNVCIKIQLLQLRNFKS